MRRRAGGRIPQMIHSLRAFRHRDYRLFFAGHALSVIGTWIQQIAMSWLVYRLTGSAWLLGVTGFAGQIAILALAPFGGLWADRFDRRKLLLATQGAAMVPAFALAALAHAGAIEPWHVIAAAAFLGVVLALDAPIRQSFTPEMVPAREDLPSAIALNGAIQNGGRMLGPAIAGVLLTVSSEAFCFLLNGVFKLAILASLALISPAPRSQAAVATRFWASLAQGATYVWNLVPARWLLPIVALASFTITPYQTLMPIFAAEVFAGGAGTLGFLIGAAGLGGLVGMALLAARENVRGLTRWTAGAAFGAGAALVAFAYSGSLALSLVLIAAAGFGVIVTAMSVSTILQTIAADSMRGRVMSFYTMAFLGMHPLGSLAAGAAASAIGAAHTLAIAGACCMAGALWLWRKLPLVRAHIRPIYAKLGIVRE
jgi:MFS family permease